MARPRDDSKIDSILESAFEVFGERGFQATGIKQVAESAGISPGTIYTYFRDKEDLFNATVEAGWARFLSRIKAVVDSPKPVDRRVADFLDIGFSTLKGAMPLLRGMLFESRQTKVFRQSIDRLCEYMEALLDAAGGRPRMDKERRRAFIKITVLGVLFSAALAEPSRIDNEIARLKKDVRLLVSGRGARFEPRLRRVRP